MGPYCNYPQLHRHWEAVNSINFCSYIQLFRRYCHFSMPTATYFIPRPYTSKDIGCFLWSRPIMLESAENRHPRLISQQIISEVFHPMWLQYLNITDRWLSRKMMMMIQRFVLLCHHMLASSILIDRFKGLIMFMRIA